MLEWDHCQCEDLAPKPGSGKSLLFDKLIVDLNAYKHEYGGMFIVGKGQWKFGVFSSQNCWDLQNLHFIDKEVENVMSFPMFNGRLYKNHLLKRIYSVKNVLKLPELF